MYRCVRLITAMVIALLAILPALTPVEATTQKSPLWGQLTSGPNAVGFETIEVYDKSRILREKYDYDGVPYDAERARPVQICVWYPAQTSPDAVPMIYGEYVFPVPDDDGFFGYVTRFQGRELGNVARALGNDRRKMAEALDIPVAAIRNAGHAEGSFPLIVYHGGRAGGIADNSVLCEYLASHGFIVAASHTTGTLSLTPDLGQADIESVIRDREFVFGQMRDYPNVDPDRTALVGSAFGGITATLMQMRNYDIDAVITIAPAFITADGRDALTANPFYDPNRALVPTLLLYSTTTEGEPDFSVMDSLVYSQRYIMAHPESDRYRLPLNVTPMELTTYAVMSVLLSDSIVADEPFEMYRAQVYYAMCNKTLTFLKARLLLDLDSQAGLAFGAERGAFTLMKARKPNPTEAQFQRMIEQGRIAKAVKIFEQLRQADSSLVFFREATLNVLGYQLLAQNQLEDARQVLRMNTVAFPQSPNSYDSYADACIATGDIESVIMCYEMVLELLPTDTLLPERFREILRTNATQGLEQFKQ